MTEFETAQLAIMNAELVNSSIGNFQSQTEIMYQQIALGHSLLFGYLLAAYFIGAALTRPQLFILNALYLIISVANVLGYIAVSLVMIELQTNLEMVKKMDTIDAATTSAFAWPSALMQILAILASLYFMWTVRKPKKE